MMSLDQASYVSSLSYTLPAFEASYATTLRMG